MAEKTLVRSTRDALRVAVIVGRLAPLLISFRRDYRGWIKWGSPVGRNAQFHQRRATKIVHTIAELGPAFVKLAQIFATRADLVPEPYLTALGTLTDRVPTIPWSDVRAVLIESWGEDPNRIVDELDTVPLAAGSLGQVHRARYQGRDVVVKVLRPHVEEIVTRDVRIARSLVDWLYKRFPHHHVLGFRVVLDEFSTHVKEEMDFEREGLQCTRMRERFADEPRLRIPRVETVLTRREVLVMEYMEGTRIDNLDSEVAAGRIRPQELVETLIEIYARMMLRDGVFHADPHPGNLLVNKEGVLILLDFGMVIEVPVPVRKALFDTIIAAVKRDAPATTDAFYALGLVAPGTERRTMQDLVDVLLTIAYSETSMDERARALADRVMRELFDWPIVLPGELVYFARTAALIEGIGARYDRSFNSIRVASPVVLKLRRELLAVLTGQDAKTAHPVVEWAAMLGAITGGAIGYLRSRTERK
ncbi:MAG: AarF/UbiB family protein [Gemmatimonadaceae bacterium]